MNLKIMTTQIYEDHEEKQEELCADYKINFVDKNIIINYNDNEIICDLEKNTVEIKRLENTIFIKLNKENNSIYKTPYGDIQLKTIGKKLETIKNPFSIKIEYKIMLGKMAEYKNIIEIIEF